MLINDNEWDEWKSEGLVMMMKTNMIQWWCEGIEHDDVREHRNDMLMMMMMMMMVNDDGKELVR